MSNHRWIRKETITGETLFAVYDHDGDDSPITRVEDFDTKDDAIQACQGWYWDELPELV